MFVRASIFSGATPEWRPVFADPFVDHLRDAGILADQNKNRQPRIARTISYPVAPLNVPQAGEHRDRDVRVLYHRLRLGASALLAAFLRRRELCRHQPAPDIEIARNRVARRVGDDQLRILVSPDAIDRSGQNR